MKAAVCCLFINYGLCSLILSLMVVFLSQLWSSVGSKDAGKWAKGIQPSLPCKNILIHLSSQAAASSVCSSHMSVAALQTFPCVGLTQRNRQRFICVSAISSFLCFCALWQGTRCRHNNVHRSKMKIKQKRGQKSVGGVCFVHFNKALTNPTSFKKSAVLQPFENLNVLLISFVKQTTKRDCELPKHILNSDKTHTHTNSTPYTVTALMFNEEIQCWHINFSKWRVQTNMSYLK